MSGVSRFGPGQPLVADTSAWVRRDAAAVEEPWRATMRAGLIAACPVITLELIAAARDDDAFLRLDRALAALPQAPVTQTVCAAAIGASRELGGSRRLPAADYLIAAAAAERGFGVLHYDSHFDVLAGVLGFESIWITPPASVD